MCGYFRSVSTIIIIIQVIILQTHIFVGLFHIHGIKFFSFLGFAWFVDMHVKIEPNGVVATVHSNFWKICFFCVLICIVCWADKNVIFTLVNTNVRYVGIRDSFHLSMSDLYAFFVVGFFLWVCVSYPLCYYTFANLHFIRIII